MKKMNLPNKLTLLRAAAIPFVVLLIALDRPTAAGILFALAAATDFLDGYLARKNDLVTDLGRFLDPVADKLLVLTAMIMLCAKGSCLPAWAVCVVAARDLAVDGLRMVSSGKGIVIAAGIFGKIKTVLQLLCVLSILFSLPTVLCTVLVWLMLAMTVLSGAIYLYRGRGALTENA